MKDISLLCGNTFFTIGGEERCGRKTIRFLDGGTGINYEQLIGDLKQFSDKFSGFTSIQIDHVSRYFYEEDKLDEDEQKLRAIVLEELMELTGGMDPHPGCYPPGILLASTWNPDTVYEVGAALGLEARMFKIACLLGTPNVNILRDPRNGRFFEGYSEDPYLAGALAKEMTKGVQSRKVAANVKHFAANNLEINRSGINEIISRRALEEIYLPAFEACVKEGKTATVMSAYNSINGTPCCENRWLLRDVLKERWGFKGVAMTDWDACKGDTGDSVAAGTDLLMPGPWKKENEIRAAVDDGRLSADELKDAAARVDELIGNACGEPFPVTYDEYIKAGDDACYKADAEGFILLKNDGLLPLEDAGRIKVEGDPRLIICGSGSAQVFTDRSKALRDVIPGSADGDVSLVVVSIKSAEGTDRPDLKMPPVYTNLVEKLHNQGQKIVLVLNTPGPVEIPPHILEYTSAILMIFYPGMAGAVALLDVLTGKINPSGKLTFTYPQRYEDTPAFLNYPDGFTCIYGEDIFVGYRGYEKRGIKALFPFGFGLSYTDFDLSDVKTDKSEYGLDDTVKVSCNLKNTGSREGATVVQLYVGDPVSKQRKPLKELRAFGKYRLKPGQTESLEFEFKISDIGSYSEDYGQFLIEGGMYDVYLGFSSEDIRQKISFRLTGGSEQLRLGINSSVLDIMNIPVLREALVKDINDAGEDIQALIESERYAPGVKITNIYKTAEHFNNFVKECNNYLKE